MLLPGGGGGIGGIGGIGETFVVLHPVNTLGIRYTKGSAFLILHHMELTKCLS